MYSINFLSNPGIIPVNMIFLYEKIPDNEKDLLYSQFINTCTEFNIKNDKSFVDIAINYQKFLDKKRAHPCAL